MRTHPEVTPEKAKAVWDSLDKPSSRKVSEAFAAAGQSVSRQQINRWRKAGWTRKQVNETDAEAAMSAMDTAAPALTGDPETRAKDIVHPPASDPAKTAVDLMRDELNMLEDTERFRAFLKEMAITGAILMRYAQQRAEVLVLEPEGAGKLMHSVAQAADVLQRVMRADFMAAADGAHIVNPQGGARNSPLADAIEAFRRAEMTIEADAA